MPPANALVLSISSPPAGFIEPCLPTLAHAVPDGSRWAFEIIHDGFRFSPGATATACGRCMSASLLKRPSRHSAVR
jgi:hypothetical protein